MTITWNSDQFLIKAKASSVTLGKVITVGDVSLPGPGEYDIQDIFVEALPLKETPQTAVVVRTEGMSVLWIPVLDGALSEKSLEALDGIEVLLLNIAEGAMSPHDADTLIAAIDPRVVVVYEKGEGSALLKKEGITAEESATVKLTAASLPQEGRRLFRLT